MARKYYALIGDIIDSKNIEDRKHTQESLDNILKYINTEYKEEIVSNFTITLGDEFQALLSQHADIMSMILIIEHALYPVKVRFAIGYGIITTQINPLVSLGADGPAYYNAREAMNYIKVNNQKNLTSNKNIWLCVNEKQQEYMIDLINSIFTLISCIKNKWTKVQFETIYNMYFCKNQTELAKKLNVKQYTINKRLNSGSYYTYIEAIETLKNTLSKEF